MADGEITLTIDADLAERLRAGADAKGQTVEAYALERLAAQVAEDGADWAEDFNRADEFDRTGQAMPVEAFIGRLRTATTERRGK